MASVTATSRVVAGALLAALLVTACTDDDPVPSASPSPSPEAAVSEPVAPTDADDLDALVAACNQSVTPPTERALAAARRSAGVADPHETSEGEDEGDASSPSTGEEARREARRAAGLATDAVADCLGRVADLGDAAAPTPDRGLELLQTRLRDLGRALSGLERGLQADASVHESADTLAAALTAWRQVAGPTRPEPSDAPS